MENEACNFELVNGIIQSSFDWTKRLSPALLTACPVHSLDLSTPRLLALDLTAPTSHASSAGRLSLTLVRSLARVHTSTQRATVSRVRFPACVSFAASVNWSQEHSVIDSAPFRRHQSLVLVLTLSFWIFKSHLIAPLGANHHHFVSDPIKACQLSRAHLQFGWPTRRVTPLRTK
ncbi:hypothetical protein BHE90_010758 [Fusarium euwallaceae]|uniref:Uncharacterized protein n=1 Tax=Fusarium euwallaceae TaxID=1147111 RepID=A0A430LGJ3_9HYPO|nr:hypothetical protein BHE90_010758 [Fusarium euwallaceae]